MLNYPLELSFKVISFGPQVRVRDATGQLVAYVKQKALKLKEDISIFADEDQQRLMYRVKADRAFDFNANYAITGANDEPVGSVRREGGRSLWKASYRLADAGGSEVALIHEENAWIRVVDSLAGEIPVLGMFAGYVFNPAYLVDAGGSTVLYMKKRPAFLEGRFTIERRGDPGEVGEQLLLPGVITTMLMERSRG